MAHTTATITITPARIKRTENEETTRARALRRMQAAIRKDCRLATEVRFLCATSVSSVSLWLKGGITTEAQRTQRLHREENQICSSTLRAHCRLTRATDKTITDPDNGLDAIAAFVELLSQSTNVHVERARIAIVTVTPN